MGRPGQPVNVIPFGERCYSSSVDSSSSDIDRLEVGDSNDVRVRFGRRVRQVRHDLGLSQEAFAARVGMHRTYIGGLERGERNVSLQAIEQLATGIDLTIAELMNGV